MSIANTVLTIQSRLCTIYGCPIPYFHELDPLSELISSLLSHRTKNKDSKRAFKQLRARFPTWEEVRDAPLDQVQDAIGPVTWPEQKAPRIQDILSTITSLRDGRLSLGGPALQPPSHSSASGGLPPSACGRATWTHTKKNVSLEDA